MARIKLTPFQEQILSIVESCNGRASLQNILIRLDREITVVSVEVALNQLVQVRRLEVGEASGRRATRTWAIVKLPTIEEMIGSMDLGEMDSVEFVRGGRDS